MTLPDKQSAQIAGSTIEYAHGGSGTPSIVLLNGAGTPIEGWDRVWNRLAELSSVFAHNRFGVGGSGKPPEPQTGQAVVAGLRELLAVAHVPPPYVLVGHSLGGLFVNLFARLHPEEAAAVVFVVATSPMDAFLLEDYGSATHRFLQRTVDLLPGPGEQSAVAHLADTAKSVTEAAGFPAVPLVVVSGGKHSPMMPRAFRNVWAYRQSQLAALSPQGRHVVARRSGHFPQVTEPDVVVEAVRRVLQDAGCYPPREAEAK